MAGNGVLCYTLPGLLCCLLQGLFIGVLLIIFYYPEMNHPWTYWGCFVAVGLIAVLVAVNINNEQHFPYLAVLLVFLLGVTVMGLKFLFTAEKMQSLSSLKATLIAGACFLLCSTACCGYFMLPGYCNKEQCEPGHDDGFLQPRDLVQMTNSNSTNSNAQQTLPASDQSVPNIRMIMINGNLYSNTVVSGPRQIDSISNFENEQRHLLFRTTPEPHNPIPVISATIPRVDGTLNLPESGARGAPNLRIPELTGSQLANSSGLLTPPPRYAEVGEEPPPSYDVATTLL